jgi:hypothetical protein
MKQFSYILTFAFLYVLLCSKSCNQREESEAAREKRGVESSIKSITAHFTADTLSKETLNGFEENAKIKVADFFDYLSILSDTSTAPGFKSHIRKIIPVLFGSSDCKIKFNSSERIKGEAVEIGIIQLVDPTSVFPAYIKGLNPDSLWIMNRLQVVEDSTYSGQLGFILLPVVQVPHSVNNKLFSGTIEYKILKREKEFGGEKLKVWNVFLGDVAISPITGVSK